MKITYENLLNTDKYNKNFMLNSADKLSMIYSFFKKYGKILGFEVVDFPTNDELKVPPTDALSKMFYDVILKSVVPFNIGYDEIKKNFLGLAKQNGISEEIYANMWNDIRGMNNYAVLSRVNVRLTQKESNFTEKYLDNKIAFKHLSSKTRNKVFPIVIAKNNGDELNFGGDYYSSTIIKKVVDDREQQILSQHIFNRTK